jgi:hypothetical protein
MEGNVGMGAIIALVSASLSTMVTVVGATAWLKSQFAELGERLAKAEALHKSLHDRVEKLEDAREEDVRRALARVAS